jgi:phosphatidylglycerol:prolipoprotein diacylglycerol transferase
MYPELFRIGDFAITSFGVFVALGALVGLWVMHRELLIRRLPGDALDGALLGVAAGLAGAKLLYVLEHLGEEPFASLALSRGGMSWFGGLGAGVGSALLLFRMREYPILPIISAATPALAIGHLLGRIGCFLVGDDYGRPSDLPWAVAFPNGLPPTTVPVHPTQLYEAIFLGGLAWLLIRWRRQGVTDTAVVGRYLLLAGAARFLIEFIRLNERVALGLTVAQWGTLAMMAFGGWLLTRRERGFLAPR